MSTGFKFELGGKVRDKITGFEGIVVYRSQWIHNCNTYGVQPEKLKDGLPLERQHFEEPCLVALALPIPTMLPERKSGGPVNPVPKTTGL